MVSQVVDIGGISLEKQHKPLNERWSKILSLRKKTVLISFGTFLSVSKLMSFSQFILITVFFPGSMARSESMPESYKTTIRETARRFPDVSFSLASFVSERIGAGALR